MDNLYCKTDIFDNSIITLSMDFKTILKLLNKHLSNEKLIDFENVEENKSIIKKRLLINPNIFLNLKIDEKIDEKELLENLIKGDIDNDSCKIEILGGIDVLKALEDSKKDSIELIINLTINLDKTNKESLFKLLNKGVNGKILLNREIELELLNEKNLFLYKVLENLNTMENSPLKDRINLNNEKKEKQLNPKSLISCIESSKFFKMVKDLDSDLVSRLLINFLTAYESSYEKIYKSKKTPMLKMCDFRYIISMFPAFHEYCTFKRITLHTQNIYDIFEIIKREDADIVNNYLNAIKSESATKALAKAHSKILIKKTYEKFNILDVEVNS